MSKVDIEKIFLDNIKSNNLLNPHERIVLGISGGPDSICLLHLFIKYKDILKVNIIVAHFNHLLRDEADSEEEFVKELAQSNGLTFISEKKDVKKHFKGDSLEQTARHLRFDFFLKVCRKYKVKKIFLAHHLDDLVETVLIRFVRGTGLMGLRGILPVSKYNKMSLIRPLLGIEKKAILSWLKTNKVKYMVDLSNFDEVFLRNNIRLNLLPLFEKLNPSFKDNVSNLSQTISYDYDFLYSLALEKFEKVLLSHRGKYIKLDIRKLDKLHISLFFMVIRIAIDKLKGNLRRIELKHLKDIYSLANQGRVGSSIDLPFLKVRKDKDFLELIHTDFS